MTRQLITLLLRAKKYTVFSTTSAKNAIELVRLHSPAVVIHELDLVDATGVELIRLIKETEMNSTPSFFALTTVTDKSRLLEMIEHGVTQVIIKHQFSVKMFYSKVESLIRSRTARLDALRQATAAAQIAARALAKANAALDNGNAPQTPSESAADTETQAVTPETPDVATAAASKMLVTGIQQGTQEAIQGDTAASRRALTPVAVRSAEEKKSVYQALKPVMTRSEALEQAEGVAEIKALSPTAARVIALTGSADASLDAIAKAIRNDHAIALKVIRVANSTAFTRGEPVSTLNDAVLRIGVQQIRQTVMNLEIMENFSSDASDYIDHRLFWEHSIGVAACCSLIAREMRLMDPDEAFTVGLLHDVGRMILNQAFGPRYTDALRFAREQQFPLEQIERRMFLIDHASIMNNVLHNWGVHKDLIQPIVNHHLSVGNIRQTCPKHVETVAMVGLADRIAHSLRIGCSGNETVYATEEFFEATKLPAGFLSMIYDKLPEMVFDMRLVMLGEMGMNGFPEPKRVCRDLILRPLYITGDSARDSIQYWVNSTGGTNENEAAPNLAVVRMRKQREDVGLEDKLRKAEKEFGIGPLPLIILSESGKLVLPDSSRINRETRLMSIPFTLDEFERTVTSLPSFAQAAAPKVAA